MQEEVNERVVLVLKGGVTLSARALDKRRLGLRFTAPYSEERRKASSERAKKHGLNTKL